MTKPVSAGEAGSLLLDRGTREDPSVVQRMLDTGAHKMLAMFAAKGRLPDNLRIRAALGDLERVRSCFGPDGALLDSGRPAGDLVASNEHQSNWPPPREDTLVVADAFLYSCRLGQREIALALIERCCALDADLAARIDATDGREPFVDRMLRLAPEGARFDLLGQPARQPGTLWRCAVELRVHEALHARDASALAELFDAEPFLLGESSLRLQERLLSVSAYTEDALPIIRLVIERDAAIVRSPSRPESHAISYALEYGHADYVPFLAQVWPIPDSLPHAAALGQQDRVQRWFGEDGAPLLEDLGQHNPFPDHDPSVTVQEILDRAFAWAVRNDEYGTADYLLAHGADLNTRWGTHEPSSVLHECAFAGALQQVKYLVSRGADRTITDARFESTAEGWARFAGHDEIADILASANEFEDRA